MGVICELARVQDEVINKFIQSTDSVDDYIDKEFHLVDATYFKTPSYRFNIDKAWKSIQYGLYPNHNTDTSHLLSKAIVHSHKFSSSSDLNAGYLYSNEVTAVWEVLREFSSARLLTNLDKVFNNPEYVSEWDWQLLTETEEEKQFLINYTLMHYTTFVAAYHSAWIHQHGLMIYFS